MRLKERQAAERRTAQIENESQDVWAHLHAAIVRSAMAYGDGGRLEEVYVGTLEHHQFVIMHNQRSHDQMPSLKSRVDITLDRRRGVVSVDYNSGQTIE